MADISSIKLPNGSTYNFKDDYTRKNYLPLTGGTLTGLLNLTPASGEGGQINLNASKANTTENGIVLDVYQGSFRIFGTASADGKTKTGTGKDLVINPYSKTITGGYTFTGNVTGDVSGNAGSATKLKNYYSTRPASANVGVIGDGSMFMFKATNSMTTAKPVADGNILHFEWDNDGGYSSQLFVPVHATDHVQHRGMEAGAWGTWKSIPFSSEVLARSGGTMTGSIKTNLTTRTHLNGNVGTGVIINATDETKDTYTMLFRMKSNNGVFTGGRWSDSYNLFYTTDTLISEGKNNITYRVKLLDEAGNSSFPGTVTATTFTGSGASLTSLNASNISSGTLSADRLATSGVTAGSYGPTAAVNGTNGTTINVPQITVDNKGRVTSVVNRVYTSVDNNTTYGVATASANGLMSAADKVALDKLATKGDSPYVKKNVVLAPSDFTLVTTDCPDGYPYRATISDSNIEESDIPDGDINILSSDVEVLYPKMNTFNGGVYVYASKIPSKNCTWFSIKFFGGGIKVKNDGSIDLSNYVNASQLKDYYTTTQSDEKYAKIQDPFTDAEIKAIVDSVFKEVFGS